MTVRTLRGLVGGLVVLGVSLGGGAGAPTGDARDENLGPAQRAAPRRCADAARVEEATLAISDVPTGFAEDPPPAPVNVLYLDGQPVRLARLGVRSVAHARHAYSQSRGTVGTPYVTDAANVFASVKDAKTVMEAFRDLAETAQTWQQTMTEPAGIGTYTASSLSFPRFGDETLAVHITGVFRDPELGVETDIGDITYVVLRHGSVLSVMVIANADAASYAAQADAKVRSILVPCPRKPAKKRARGEVGA